MSTILAFARILLFGWIAALIRLFLILRDVCRAWKSRKNPKPLRCIPINHPAFLRPDPLLYSQRALQAKGLAVTWDNPDITLFKGGVPVSSSDLLPATTYEVRVRVWNNSFVAPVVQLPVRLSFLSFGVATQSHPIGSTTVDVGVKGSASQPATASIPWTTPPTPGHYCLEALLDPVDDLDFLNNLGQENTDVSAASSPASFKFTLRNDTRRSRKYRFETDAYALGEPLPCGAEGPEQRLARHRRGRHPLQPGFAIVLTPDAPVLAPNAEVAIDVQLTPPSGWTGRQPINVNCFHEAGFAGGVTLIVTKGV